MDSRERLFVNDEAKNLLRIHQHVPQIYGQRMQPITDEVLVKIVKAFRMTASGGLFASPDWRFGLAIDDMIARAHDVGEHLPWNNGPVSVSADVARYLGWLNRLGRNRLGKRVVEMCVQSEATGQPNYFSHYQRSRGTVSVFVVSGMSRKERLRFLEFLVSYAHFKYGAKQSFGVARDAGVSGRFVRLHADP